MRQISSRAMDSTHNISVSLSVTMDGVKALHRKGIEWMWENIITTNPPPTTNLQVMPKQMSTLPTTHGSK